MRCLGNWGRFSAPTVPAKNPDHMKSRAGGSCSNAASRSRDMAYLLTFEFCDFCRASSSALVGRPRRGISADLTARSSKPWLMTCSASQSSTSSARQSKRLVPGKRQIGGSEQGLRVASLRMLATDLCGQRANSSTVKSTTLEVVILEVVIEVCFMVITHQSGKGHQIAVPVS